MPLWDLGVQCTPNPKLSSLISCPVKLPVELEINKV